MFVKQIEVGGMAIFAYLVACKVTNEALFIDPAAETGAVAQHIAVIFDSSYPTPHRV